MTAFAAATDVLFADPHLARDAVYRPAGAGDGIPVRVMLRQPDRIESFGETRLASSTTLLDVRVSEVAEPAAGMRVTATTIDSLGQIMAEEVRAGEQAATAAVRLAGDGLKAAWRAQIVDASLVAAPRQRNTDEEKAAIKAGKTAAEIWPEKPAKAA